MVRWLLPPTAVKKLILYIVMRSNLIMTQKQIAKQYSFLNGKEIKVYIGRVPCKMKHIEKELSTVEKENTYGKYEAINIIIQKTHFNGKTLTITPKYFSCVGSLIPFKIEQIDIGALIVTIAG